MSYLRRKKLTRLPRAKSGNQPVSSDLLSQAGAYKTDSDIADQLTVVEIESIYDDEIRIVLLEQAEESLRELEDLIDDRLKDFKVLIDPDKNPPLVRAISILKGEPTLVLDADVLNVAMDLAQDGASHLNGFDPVAAILGLHGGTEDMPFAPEAEPFAECDEMQNLSNIPGTNDPNYAPGPIDEINTKQEMSKWLDIFAKLWRIIKYFPGVDIRNFLKKLKNRWTRRPVGRAISWVECHMVKPGWFLLSGEPQTCSAAEASKEAPDKGENWFMDAEDLEATGMDCIEAATSVLKYLQVSQRNNKDIENFYNVREERSDHEALKFGTIVSNIKNKKRYEDRVEKLYEKSKNIPRYKKRFYEHKDSFNPAETGRIILKTING